jgi:CRP/FNR family cyclic AMP-dependent transcriptional regulator
MMEGGSLHERFGRSFAAGTVLFREGDPGFDMFVIHSGRVQLTRKLRQQEAVIATLPTGEFFGEMAIVNNRPRTATATVLEDSVLLVIDQRTFEAMIRGNAEIAVRIIKKLAGRLDQANAQVEVLLLKDVNHRLVHYLRRIAETNAVREGAGLRIDLAVSEIADRIGLEQEQTEEALERLTRARLIHRNPDGRSLMIAEVGRLDDFLEFLEMKERFGDL